MASSPYHYVGTTDSTEEFQSANELDSKELHQIQVTAEHRRQYGRIGILLCTTCILLSTASIYTLFYPISRIYQSSNTTSAQLQGVTCRNPALRQEWRTLSIQQKRAYISAVQCLQTKPSKLGMDHKLHDEFTWLHSRLGNFSRLLWNISIINSC